LTWGRGRMWNYRSQSLIHKTQRHLDHTRAPHSSRLPTPRLLRQINAVWCYLLVIVEGEAAFDWCDPPSGLNGRDQWSWKSRPPHATWDTPRPELAFENSLNSAHQSGTRDESGSIGSFFNGSSEYLSSWASKSWSMMLRGFCLWTAASLPAKSWSAGFQHR